MKLDRETAEGMLEDGYSLLRRDEFRKSAHSASYRFATYADYLAWVDDIHKTFNIQPSHEFVEYNNVLL